MKRSSLRGSTYMRLVQYAKLSGAANTAVNYAGFLPSCASKPNNDNDDDDDYKNTQPCLDAGGEGSRCWRLAASLPGHVGDAVDGEGASSLRWRREKRRGGEGGGGRRCRSAQLIASWQRLYGRQNTAMHHGKGTSRCRRLQPGG